MCLALVLAIQSAQAQIQTDFDRDSTSDVTHFAANGAELVWNARGSASAEEELGQTFGASDDGLALAHWVDAETSNLGTVYQESVSDNLVWRILLSNGKVRKQYFGSAGELCISGADFDGNGIADAAVVKNDGKDLIWTVRYNLFASKKVKTKQFRFGKDGDRAFFINRGGTQDWVAVFGAGSGAKARLSLRNVRNGKVITKNKFQKSFAKNTRPRPFPVQNVNGSDAIAFVIADDRDTSLFVYDLEGRTIADEIFPGVGSEAVGDFDAEDPGEEIALQTSSGLTIFNPFSGALSSRTSVGGILADEINISQNITKVPETTAIAAFTPTVAPLPTGNRRFSH